MKTKNLFLLTIVAVVLVGAAIWMKKGKSAGSSDTGRSRTDSGDVSKNMLPDLPVNDVTKIVVRSASSTATVERVDDTWVASSKFNYPVDFSKVRKALLKLKDLEYGQRMRLNDDQRKDLRMIPPDAENGGTLVSLSNSSGTSLGELLMGDTHKNQPTGGAQSYGGYADGRYVSVDEGESVYLVREPLSDIPDHIKEWLDTEVANVSSSDILSISITGPDRKPVELKRPEKGKSMELQDLGEKEQLKTSKIYGIESAISYLRLSDIADPALTDQQLGFDKPIVFTATTVKDEIYTVKIGSSPTNSTDRYVRLSVAMKPEPPKPEEKKIEGEQNADSEKKVEGAKKEGDAGNEDDKKAKERKETEDKVNKLNEKLSKWTYVIESYKADSMTTKRADLVEPKKEEKKEDSTKAAKPAPVEKPAVKPAPAKKPTVETPKTEPKPKADAKAPVEPAVTPAPAKKPAVETPKTDAKAPTKPAAASAENAK